MALADRGDRLDVARRRRPHATGPDHGLAEERRDPVGADALDLGLERLGRLVVDVRHRAEQRAVALAHRLHADEARAEAVRAVVGERAADQVDAVGLSHRRPVLARELGRGVDRVAAPEAQEDARIGHRRELHEALDELERRRVGDVAERLERLEGAELLHDRLGHLLSTVPDVGVPQAGRAVEVAAAVVVPEVDALPAGDHELVAGDGRHVGERVPVGARHAGDARSAPPGCQAQPELCSTGRATAAGLRPRDGIPVAATAPSTAAIAATYSAARAPSTTCWGEL